MEKKVVFLILLKSLICAKKQPREDIKKEFQLSLFSKMVLFIKKMVNGSTKKTGIGQSEQSKAESQVKKQAEVLPEMPISKEILPEKPVATDFTPWMRIAYMEVGVTESKNPKRVIEYHQATTLKAKDTATAWCSSFACWVLQQAGYKTTKSAWARDWLKYGEIADLQEGCIVVMERNGPGGDSHVGFYTGKQTAKHIELLSGNSGNSVCLKMYPKKDLLSMRWPVKS